MPGLVRTFKQSWLPITPVGTNSAASCPSQVGNVLFQLVHRWVLGIDIIAKLGRHHRLDHPRRWLGDGIAAEVYWPLGWLLGWWLGHSWNGCVLGTHPFATGLSSWLGSWACVVFAKISFLTLFHRHFRSARFPASPFANFSSSESLLELFCLTTSRLFLLFWPLWGSILPLLEIL
ncbi:MAG: hypothetical protein UZ07_CHB004000793 [Chlorobi bacterium OLB7]|nr:MAG: hypothetical protein UZ07_CHB004000793 [Chlorobi bacterium OLB7]